MNSVTQTQIVCGNKFGNETLNWANEEGSIHCKKEKNDNKEIPVTNFDVISAFDFLHDKGLQVDHRNDQTHNVMYPIGMSLHYLIIVNICTCIDVMNGICFEHLFCVIISSKLFFLHLLQILGLL